MKTTPPLRLVASTPADEVRAYRKRKFAEAEKRDGEQWQFITLVTLVLIAAAYVGCVLVL